MRPTLSQLLRSAPALLVLMLSVSAMADTWQLKEGAQSGDRANQALAFLPNEIWIHAGETVEWTNLDGVTAHT